MEKYSKYKDSGVKWIGDVIPAHWKVMRGKSIFNLITERSQSEVKIGLENIESFTGRYVDTETMFDSEGVQVRVGDIVYGKLRPYLCKVWLASFDCNAVGDFYIFRCKDEENTKYILQLFLSHEFTGITNASTYGARMPRVSSSFILSLNFPLPPLAEQHAIVSYLDGKVGQIDTYIAKQTQQIELLKELKQAVIANAVTKGIANDNNHHTKLKQSGISWIGEIPEHWEVKRLGLFFTENKTINSCMQCIEAYKFNYGTLIRKDEDIDPNELKDIYNKYTILKPRDIVINGLNLNYDFVSQRVALSTSTGIITSAYIVLSPRTRVHELFFYYLLKSMDGMKLFHGMGTGIRLTLSFKELKYQLLPIPPLSEQRAIVSYIEAQTANIDKLIDAYQQQVERIKEYKQRLISDAVTGKMNVTGKQTQTN